MRNIQRILNQQHLLFDEGNPAWGLNTSAFSPNYSTCMFCGITTSSNENRICKNCQNLKPTLIKLCKSENKNQDNNMENFLQEVQDLAKNYKSPKIEELKIKIKKAAASGETQKIFDSHLYDRNTINWLKAEGFVVKETCDQRDGDFITVKWG